MKDIREHGEYMAAGTILHEIMSHIWLRSELLKYPSFRNSNTKTQTEIEHQALGNTYSYDFNNVSPKLNFRRGSIGEDIYKDLNTLKNTFNRVMVDAGVLISIGSSIYNMSQGSGSSSQGSGDYTYPPPK